MTTIAIWGLACLAQLAPAPATNAQPFPSLDTQALVQLLKSDSNLLVIDFRNEASYDDGHLPFAVNVSFEGEDKPGKSETRLTELLKTKPRPIVLYGLEPLRLFELAARVASRNAGQVSIYPAGLAGWAAYEGGYLEIEWRGLWRLLTLSSPAILDVRPADAFAAGHIPGAKRFETAWTGGKSLPQAWSALREASAVITYCDGEVCGDSRRTAEALSRHGVRNVYLFAGGYPEWDERTAGLKNR